MAEELACGSEASVIVSNLVAARAEIHICGPGLRDNRLLGVKDGGSHGMQENCEVRVVLITSVMSMVFGRTKRNGATPTWGVHGPVVCRVIMVPDSR